MPPGLGGIFVCIFRVEQRLDPCEWVGWRAALYGTRRKPIHGGLAKTSMFLTVPTRAARQPPPTDGRMRLEDQDQEQRRRASLYGSIPLATDQPSMGRRGWVCGTVENMDVFYKPPWMGSRRVPQTHPRRPSTVKPQAAGFDLRHYLTRNQSSSQARQAQRTHPAHNQRLR